MCRGPFIDDDDALFFTWLVPCGWKLRNAATYVKSIAIDNPTHQAGGLTTLEC